MKYKRQVLSAINKLIKYYKSFEGERVGRMLCCPLCDIPCKEDEDDCANCPWWVIDNTICIDDDYHRQTKTERLKRLNRWKESIEKVDK